MVFIITSHKTVNKISAITVAVEVFIAICYRILEPASEIDKLEQN